MSTVPYWQTVQEQEYFNWKCILCSVIASSPLHLEDQWLVEHGPYKDVDNELWVKCNKCYNPYHVKCLPSVPPSGEFICTFICSDK